MFLKTEKLIGFIDITTGELTKDSQVKETKELNDVMSELVEEANNHQEFIFEDQMLTSLNEDD